MFGRGGGRGSARRAPIGVNEDIPSYIRRPPAPQQQERYDDNLPSYIRRDRDDGDVRTQRPPTAHIPRPVHIPRQDTLPEGRRIVQPPPPPPPRQQQYAVASAVDPNEQQREPQKRKRFQHSPPRRRHPNDGKEKEEDDAEERRLARKLEDGQRTVANDAVPLLSDDRVDKTIHWKDVHGIKIDEVLQLDKEVRQCRFKPTDDLRSRIQYTLHRMRYEQNFSTREFAEVLYKGGIKSIWIEASPPIDLHDQRAWGRALMFSLPSAYLKDAAIRGRSDKAEASSVSEAFDMLELSITDMPSKPKN